MTLRSFKPSVLCEKERKNVLVKEREIMKKRKRARDTVLKCKKHKVARYFS